MLGCPASPHDRRCPLLPGCPRAGQDKTMIKRTVDVESQAQHAQKRATVMKQEPLFLPNTRVCTLPRCRSARSASNSPEPPACAPGPRLGTSSSLCVHSLSTDTNRGKCRQTCVLRCRPSAGLRASRRVGTKHCFCGKHAARRRPSILSPARFDVLNTIPLRAPASIVNFKSPDSVDFGYFGFSGVAGSTPARIHSNPA